MQTGYDQGENSQMHTSTTGTMHETMHAGGTLQILREAQGLTEAQVAEAIGVSEKRYHTLEQAPGKMLTRQLETLATLFGVEPSALVDFC